MTPTNATFVKLCVVVKGTGKKSGAAQTSSDDASNVPPLAPLPMDDHVKEIVVIRHPYPIVHLYDIVEHGRRYYRTQVFSSSTQRSLATISPRPFDNALLVPPPKKCLLL